MWELVTVLPYDLADLYLDILDDKAGFDWDDELSLPFSSELLILLPSNVWLFYYLRFRISFLVWFALFDEFLSLNLKEST